MDEYPKEVRPCDVAGSIFGAGLFKIKGGRAVYDEVWVSDHATGNSFYLCRLDPDNLHVTRRWIPWHTVLVQLYDPTEAA